MKTFVVVLLALIAHDILKLLWPHIVDAALNHGVVFVAFLAVSVVILGWVISIWKEFVR